jgi:predicted nucleotidyltransferase component of viral defense system
MLEFNQIKEYFGTELAPNNDKAILVEYLQYEFLDSLFKDPAAKNLSFIGGTAIRIIHSSQRFSEDLDFDNFGLSFFSFEKLVKKALTEINLKGLKTETRLLNKDNNFHAYIKFPDLLHELGISGHKEAKIFLSVDLQKKAKIFEPEVMALNKFGVFRKILVNPANILLAQKLITILERKREKGRDFYDVSFLNGRTKPDYNYIQRLTGLNKLEFGQKIIAKCQNLNFKKIAKDVEPFLLDRDQIKRVLLFKEQLPAILN